MELKKFFAMAFFAVAPICAFADSLESELGLEIQAENETETETPDTIVWDQEGFRSAHAAMNNMADRFGLRYDIEYNDNGSVNVVTSRGGLYLSPRVGFEYNYLFSSKTTYPSFIAELGIGYRTKRLDARAYVGVATSRYGKLSDKEGNYLAPRISVEVLYEVARDKKYEENLFKIGGELNYHLRRAYAVSGNYMFSFVGSYPGVSFILEYERQFWGSRSSIAIGMKVGTDYEPGNGTCSWGIVGGVYASYRIGIQKKSIYRGDSDAK